MGVDSHARHLEVVHETVIPYRDRSGLTAREGVTRVRIPRRESLPEPRRALLRGTVRERFAVHAAPRLLLDTVVTDRRRGRQTRLDVARLEDLLFLGVVRPHSG